MKNIHNKINSNEYKFYLKEEKYFNEPKFSTKIFLDKISNISEKKLTFVDVGCANGALLSYIENNIPNWNLVGIDIDDELIKDAIDRQLSANFFVLDFLLPNQVPIKADIVHAAGIINIFKDPKAFIDSLINIANPKATIFIHGIFNPYDIDVQVSYTDYSRSNIKSNSPFNGRWNNYSIRTISDIL